MRGNFIKIVLYHTYVSSFIRDDVMEVSNTNIRKIMEIESFMKLTINEPHF